MSLLGAFGGQNSGSYNGGEGVPAFPYKKQYDGTFHRGSDGRYALERPDGSLAWTSMSPGDYRQYMAQTGAPDLVDGGGTTTPMGSLPGSDQMFQDRRPTFEQQTGQVTVDGHTRPFDPVMDDPRNRPNHGAFNAGKSKEQQQFDNWLNSVPGLAALAGLGISWNSTEAKNLGFRPGMQDQGRSTSPEPNYNEQANNYVNDARVANPGNRDAQGNLIPTGNATSNPVDGTRASTSGNLREDLVAQGIYNANPTEANYNALNAARAKIGRGPASRIYPTPTGSPAAPSAAPGATAAGATAAGAVAAGAAGGAGGLGAKDLLPLAPVVAGALSGAAAMGSAEKLAEAEGLASTQLSSAAIGNTKRALDEYNEQKTRDGLLYDEQKTRDGLLYDTQKTRDKLLLDQQQTRDTDLHRDQILRDGARYDNQVARDTRLFNQQQTRGTDLYNQQRDDLSPYRQDGERALGLLDSFDANNPNFTEPARFGMDQFQQDDGYGFRLREGLDALQKSAIARGNTGGNAMKAINNYAQDSASQEYNNAFNRYTTENNDRFNRYSTQREGNRNALLNRSQQGLNAVSQGNQAAQNYGSMMNQSAQNYGNTMNQGAQQYGNAMSQGAQNYSNAMNQGAQHYGNAMNQGAQHYGNAMTQGSQNYVQNAGQYDNQGAAARAAGITGAAGANVAGYQGGINSVIGGITGAANMYQQNQMMAQLMKMYGGKT